MLIILRNGRHHTEARFRISHSGQALSKALVARLRKKLCPVGCCVERLPQSGPRHISAQQVMILILNGAGEVYYKAGVER